MAESNTQDAAAAVSVLQEEAIRQARATFARLPRGDAAFRECLHGQQSLASMIEALAQKASSHQSKRSTRILTGIHRYTTWMNNMSGSIDVAVQTMAGIACPVWAPLKYLLKLSEDNMEAAEQIVLVVQTISENLPRLEIYEQIHTESRFRIGLLNVFSSVVEFAVRACRYFRSGWAAKLGRLVWRTAKQDLGGIITDIDRRTKALDDMASALSQAKNSKFINDTEVEQQQELRIRCMQWLSPSNMRDYLERTEALRADNTCEWIFTHNDFLSWKASASSELLQRCLIIHGPAGCGKSVLAAFLCNRLMHSNIQDTSQSSKILMFSFLSTGVNRRSSDAMARSLLSQFLEQDDSGASLPLFNNAMAKSPPSASEMLGILTTAIRTLSCDIIAIVDGIDESSDPIDATLDYLLKTLKTCRNLRIVILGRSHKFGRLYDSEPRPCTISITPETNRADIETFIRVEMSRYEWSPSPATHGAVFTSLSSTADGMFLWVRLTLDYLSRAVNEHEIVRRLTELPNGLEQAYIMVLKRLMTRFDRHELKMSQTIFLLVLTASRPLAIEELRFCCAVVAREDAGSTADSIELFMPRFDTKRVIELCGELLSFDGIAFRLLHNSVSDFLTRPISLWAHHNDQDILPFRILIPDAHQTLANICISGLLDTDFGKFDWQDALSSQTPGTERPFLEYAISYAAYHLNRTESLASIQQALLCLYTSDQCFFMVEYFFLLSIKDSSMYPLLEMFKLIDTVVSESMDLDKVLPNFTSRFEGEYASRLSQFGEFNPHAIRGKLWVDTFSSFSHMFQEKSSDSGVAATESQTLPIDDGMTSSTTDTGTSEDMDESFIIEDGSVTPDDQISEAVLGEAVVTSQHAEVSESRFRVLELTTSGRDHMSQARHIPPLQFDRMRELLQHIHGASVTHQFEFLLRLTQQLARLRKLTDPLEALWRMLKAKATSMPVILLIGVILYYTSFDKFEKAYELATICLGRVTERDAITKPLVELLMGSICFQLDKNEEAIPHIESSLPKIERFLKNSRSANVLLFHPRVMQARCYDTIADYEKAASSIGKALEVDLGHKQEIAVLAVRDGKFSIPIHSSISPIEAASKKDPDSRRKLVTEAIHTGSAGLVGRGDLAWAYQLRGSYHFSLGRIGDAFADYSLARTLWDAELVGGKMKGYEFDNAADALHGFILAGFHVGQDKQTLDAVQSIMSIKKKYKLTLTDFDHRMTKCCVFLIMCEQIHDSAISGEITPAVMEKVHENIKLWYCENLISEHFAADEKSYRDLASASVFLSGKKKKLDPDEGGISEKADAICHGCYDLARLNFELHRDDESILIYERALYLSERAGPMWHQRDYLVANLAIMWAHLAKPYIQEEEFAKASKSLVLADILLASLPEQLRLQYKALYNTIRKIRKTRDRALSKSSSMGVVAESVHEHEPEDTVPLSRDDDTDEEDKDKEWYFAHAVVAYDGNEEDVDALSFEKDEILEISYVEESRGGPWWPARRSNGERGVVPIAYLIVISGETFGP